jgi:hypothetical protein
MASLNNSFNEDGIAMPYLAIFGEDGTPVMNKLTGVPLGAYITKFTYKYDEEKENQASITFETGDPDTVDLDELQENKTILRQWGYVYPSGSFISSPVKSIKVKDFNCTFNSTGTHVTIVCVDGVSSLRHVPPHPPCDASDLGDGKSSMVDFLDRGCDREVGVIIEYFELRQ